MREKWWDVQRWRVTHCPPGCCNPHHATSLPFYSCCNKAKYVWNYLWEIYIMLYQIGTSQRLLQQPIKLLVFFVVLYQAWLFSVFTSYPCKNVLHFTLYFTVNWTVCFMGLVSKHLKMLYHSNSGKHSSQTFNIHPFSITDKQPHSHLWIIPWIIMD